jgi:PncC family amidohydrolase
LSSVAERLAALIAHRRYRLVLAESCTGGLAAAALATIPGISDWFCGSFVAYRRQSKQVWLEISDELLEHYSTISVESSRAMALAALTHTPETDWSAAITGHLGPNAPSELDGRVFVSIAKRAGDRVTTVEDVERKLTSALRQSRQCEATAFFLDALWRRLADERKQ